MGKRRAAGWAAAGVTAALGMAIGPAAAAHAAGSFDCEATALRGSLLGQPAVEPVTANKGAGTCRTASAGGNLPLPAPLKAGVVTAQTTAEAQSAGAKGGLADVRIGALPGLPIPLPTDQLNGLGAVTIPLPSVPAIDQALSQLGSATGGLTGGSGSGGTGDVLGGLAGGGASGGGGGTPIGGVLGGVLNPLLGDTGGLRAARPRALGDVVAITPGSITLDLRPAVQALLAQTPSPELLSVQLAQASASATCSGGRPQLRGTPEIAGVRVLGQDLPTNAVTDQLLKLVDTTNIDLSQLDLSKIQLPGGLSLADPTIGPALQQAIRTVLAGLPPIQIPETLARVKVTPGAQTATANALTQQALRVEIGVAGQSVADLTVGEATVRYSGNPCGPDAAPAGAASGTPTNVAEASLQCTRRKLVLIDVLERNGRVRLYGAGDHSLVGRTATIVFNDGKRVAKAKIRKDGSFSTTAPLPPSNVRFTNDARYKAVVGKEKSLNLKLHRRLLVQKVSAKGGRITISGRVVRPLGSPVQTVTIKRRVTCRKQQVVKRFKPRADGRFRVTLKAPNALGVAVYRFQTKVRKNTHNPKLFPTFTLPRAVELRRS